MHTGFMVAVDRAVFVTTAAGVSKRVGIVWIEESVSTRQAFYSDDQLRLGRAVIGQQNALWRLRSMTLRTRFLLITGVATVALAGVSEWVTYQQTAAFLDAHEALMRHGPEGAALLTLPVAKHLLLVKLTGLRLLNAGVATFALIVLLNVVWARFIADPIRLLRKHINWMSRGTWKTPITIRQRDEMGDLTKAFNALVAHHRPETPRFR